MCIDPKYAIADYRYVLHPKLTDKGQNVFLGGILGRYKSLIFSPKPRRSDLRPLQV